MMQFISLMASVGQVTLLAVPFSVSCPRQQKYYEKKKDGLDMKGRILHEEDVICL